MMLLSFYNDSDTACMEAQLGAFNVFDSVHNDDWELDLISHILVFEINDTCNHS